MNPAVPGAPRANAVYRVVAAVVAALAIVSPAGATEVRIGEDPTRYSAYLVRAYAPCTAPNDVARNGIAACSPPVTSEACPFETSKFRITQSAPLDFPRGSLGGWSSLFPTPAACLDAYFVDATTRVSGDFIDPDTLPCPSGQCTFQDFVNRWKVNRGYGGFVDLLGLPPLIPLRPTFPIEANREIVRVGMTGMDGLPLATIGLEPSTSATTMSSNLTVPYEPCTMEYGSACDRVPWSSVCDFESGTITWTQLDDRQPPSVHVTLRDVAGSSPLCASGTYHLETTVRSTIKGCGDLHDPHLCTLVDQTFSLPLSADGRQLDATAVLPLGTLGFSGRFTNTEIVSMRVLDPTGQALAAPGTPTFVAFEKPQITMKGGELRFKATIPVEGFDVQVTPTLRSGFTLTMSDRDGTVYAVNIPALLWQLQPPVGSGWTYEDPGGSIGGVRKVRIKRVGRPEAIKGYKLDFRASGVDLSGADFPGVTVVVETTDSYFLTPLWARGNRTCLVKGTKRLCK